MSPQDQLADIQSRMDAIKARRRFASAVGRRSEASQWDLELDGLEYKEADLKEKITEFSEGWNSESPA
jgi:hypothetical protein